MDFPDELDTSFFARVSQKSLKSFSLLNVLLLSFSVKRKRKKKCWSVRVRDFCMLFSVYFFIFFPASRLVIGTLLKSFNDGLCTVAGKHTPKPGGF